MNDNNDLQQATQVVQTTIDEYFKTADETLKQELGEGFSDEDKTGFMQVLAQAKYDPNVLFESLVHLLEEIGYNEEQVQNAVNELQTIISMRIMVELYSSVSLEKLEALMDMNTELTPAQLNAAIETVYANENDGKSLSDVTKELTDSTYQAFYGDIKKIWDNYQATIAQ